MTLTDLVGRLDSLSDDEMIVARRPWTAESQCAIVRPADDLGVPTHVKQAGFEYFLEVHVAKEVVGVLRDRPILEQGKVDLLLFYAEHDAYPQWVYDNSR